MVYYETLAGPDGARELRRVSDFLLGDARDRCETRNGSETATVHKIHARPLAESIRNYDDVASKLAKTRFAKFLEPRRAAARGR